jgi:hypothetical protein
MLLGGKSAYTIIEGGNALDKIRNAQLEVDTLLQRRLFERWATLAG